MSIDALVIQNALEDHRLPEYLIKRVMVKVNGEQYWRLKAGQLEHRVAYLEQHVPPEIANPPPPPEPYRPHRRND